MMALVLGALLLARRGRPQFGGLLWALAIAVKPVPLVLLPLAALAAGRLRGFGWIGFAAGVLAIAITATAAFGTAWISSAAPVGQLDRVSSVSIPYWVAKLDVSWRYPSAGLTLLFGLAYLVLLVQAWHGRARLGLAAGLLALSLAWLMPWYALWSVSLAAWEEDRVAKAVALVLTLYLLRDTVPL
jgi:alpha-1,6-mannosyltransferase